jgi:hypothetical protein
MEHRWRMLRSLVFASMFVTVTASAQAPGEAPLAAPGMVTPQPIYAAPYRESVMANRWEVGLGIGSLGIAPKDQPNDKTQFGIGELSVHYRATLHLELGLELAGGQETDPSGKMLSSPREVSTGALSLRYRFEAEFEWNWWLMGGLGSLSVTEKDATDQQRKDAQRPLAELGLGVERRFHHFALNVELRAIGVGPQKNQQAVPVMSQPTAASQTTMPPSKPAPQSDQMSGGMLTIGASYYF